MPAAWVAIPLLCLVSFLLGWWARGVVRSANIALEHLDEKERRNGIPDRRKPVDEKVKAKT